MTGTPLRGYTVTTKWWELVPPPAWIERFWFTEMIWNLCVHHSCSLDTYHYAESAQEAQVLAYEYVTENMPGPQYRVLVGRGRLPKPEYVSIGGHIVELPTKDRP